jgi:hypothetical protein
MLLIASACTASATPTPAPTRSATVSGFASEEEAFQAAEDTYRAYIDALNRVDLADPATFEPVYALTTGDASAAVHQDFAQMHADGWVVKGTSVLQSIDVDERSSTDRVYLLVCTDVRRVTLVDGSGDSQVSSDRADVHSLTIEMISNDERWSVDRIRSRAGDDSCV